MDLNKFNVLAELVREARVADREATAVLEAARSAWTAANAVLTDRHKVFDEFVNQQKSEAISFPKALGR